MFHGANISDALLIIAGVILLPVLLTVALTSCARVFDWFSTATDRYISISIACEHCGAPFAFKGRDCKSCGRPISEGHLRRYKLRMLTVSSWMLAILSLILGNFLAVLILLVLGLLFWGCERRNARITRDSGNQRTEA